VERDGIPLNCRFAECHHRTCVRCKCPHHVIYRFAECHSAPRHIQWSVRQIGEDVQRNTARAHATRPSTATPKSTASPLRAVETGKTRSAQEVLMLFRGDGGTYQPTALSGGYSRSRRAGSQRTTVALVIRPSTALLEERSSLRSGLW